MNYCWYLSMFHIQILAVVAVSYRWYLSIFICLIVDFCNMWAVLGPARPEEGTTCFRAGLGLYFYSLGWHGTARNFSGPSRPDPFWPEARWAWAVPARPGPIPSTNGMGGRSLDEKKGRNTTRMACNLSVSSISINHSTPECRIKTGWKGWKVRAVWF